jgi:hypothetical protein
MFMEENSQTCISPFFGLTRSICNFLVNCSAHFHCDMMPQLLPETKCSYLLDTCKFCTPQVDHAHLGRQLLRLVWCSHCIGRFHRMSHRIHMPDSLLREQTCTHYSRKTTGCIVQAYHDSRMSMPRSVSCTLDTCHFHHRVHHNFHTMHQRE